MSGPVRSRGERRRGGPSRHAWVVVAAGMVTVLSAGPAAAQEATPPPEPGSVCTTLDLTQTYRGWGPALAYRRPAVTVRYQAPGCSITHGDTLNLIREGTATVRRGPTPQGRVIDRRPFQVKGVWQNPSNPLGWPLDWWTCQVTYAQYVWQIPNVYTFSVRAQAGHWTLEVRTRGRSPRLVWAYDACSTSGSASGVR